MNLKAPSIPFSFLSRVPNFPNIIGWASLVLLGSVVLASGGKNALVWQGASAGICFLAVLSLLREESPLSTHPLGPWMVGWGLWVLFVWVGARSGGEGFPAVQKMGTAMAMGGVSHLYWDELKKNVFRWGVIGVAAVHGLSLFVYTAGAGDFRLFPANPHYGALWLTVAILMALSLVPAKSRQRPIWLILIGGLWAALWFSNVRSCQMASLLGLGVWLKDQGIKIHAKKILWVSLPLAGAAVSLDWSRWLKLYDPLSWKRWDIWREALAGILERPFMGWGPGGFPRVDQIHRLAQEVLPVRYEMSTPFAHNDFLQLAAEQGLPGLLFGGIALGLYFKSSKRERGGLGAQAAVVAVLVTAFFNFPFALPVNALLLAALLGSSLPREEAPRATLSSPWAKRLRLGALLGLFLLGAGGGYGVWGDLRFRWGGEPGVLDPRWREHSFDSMDRILHGAAETEAEGEAWVEARLSQILRYYPLSAEAWRWKGHLEADHHLPPRGGAALAAYDRALALAPSNVLWGMERVSLLERRGEWVQARKEIHRLLALEPRCGAASIALGRVLRGLGEYQRSEQWLKALASTWDRTPLRTEGLSPYARWVLHRDLEALDRELKLTQNRIRP